ncbi:MAG TPA: hypothetical protein VEY67_04345 [Candidatus Dormibacteraeota bacterium]|nr:hypothetical protein [Candidatus Dormibacteraeota bacterium]
MTRPLVRRALAILLPGVVLAVLTCGLVYTVAQQVLRIGANDPQIQLAEDAAAALDHGTGPAAVVPPTRVDVGTSLAPFVVVFDPAGRVLATNGQLDGHDPVPPLGVLSSALPDRRNSVTWQPRPGVRVATVTVAWRGGTVLAGRSLREVEAREDLVLQLCAAGLAVMLVGLAIAFAAGAWMWPRAWRGLGPQEPGAPH